MKTQVCFESYVIYVNISFFPFFLTVIVKYGLNGLLAKLTLAKASAPFYF